MAGSAGTPWRYTHLGLQFALTIALFVYGGYWLDRRLGTVVLFTVVLTMLGFGVALYHLYKSVVPSSGAGFEPASEDGAKEKGDGTPDA